MAATMGTSSIIRHGMRRGIRQITRDRTWGTTLLLLTALMLLMQFLVVFLVGVFGANRFLISQASLQLEVLANATTADIQQLNAALQAEPFVQDVQYVTGEQAYEREKARDPELITFLEEYKLENPFPNTFLVTLSSLQSYDVFTTFIKQARWQTVVNPSYLTSVTDQERQSRLLLHVTESIGTFSLISVGVAFLILCFVILEWVMRAMARRREELQLEYLLGARPLSMVVPYASEMTLLLLLATVVSMLVAIGVLFLMPMLFPALAHEPSFAAVRSGITPLMLRALPLVLLVEVLLMPALALGGSFLGARSTLGKRAIAFP